MRIRLLALWSLLAFAGLSCTEECDEPDVDRINAPAFELVMGGENGYTQEDLNALFFVRYVPLSDPLIADTVYANGSFPEGENKFYINDNYPFRNDQSPYYTVYDYLVETPGSINGIGGIDLEGEYDGDCGYINTKKSFYVNADTIDMAGTVDTYYPLTK